MPRHASIGQLGFRQVIDRILRSLFKCRPAAALALLLGSLIASVSMLVLAPQAPLYAALSVILFLPNWVWPGVLLEGIRVHHGTEMRPRSGTVWACIACVILIDAVFFPLLGGWADEFRIAFDFANVAGFTATAIDLWVFWTVAKVLVQAEDGREAPATRVIGTFVQFLFLPLCVYVLQRRAQRLVRSGQ